MDSTANVGTKRSGEVVHFGPSEREELRAAIRAASINEQRAADIAEELSRAWVRPLIEDDTIDVGACVVHKAAGFNAGLHEHVRKALRAHAGATAWIGARGGSSGAIVRFSLDDLRLGEYHAILLWESLGAKIETPRERGALIGAMARTMPGASDAPGFPTFEIDLSRAPAPLPKGPIDVLFVASMDNYLNPMIPVMSELLARGLRVGVMLPGQAVGFGNAARIPADVVRLAFTDVLTPELVEIGERERARVAGAWRSREHEVAASLRNGPVDLWPLAGRDLERMAVEYLPRATQFWRAGEGLVRGLGVRAIVGARMRRACDIAIMLGARNAGCRASILIHGHITDAPERRFDDGSYENLDAIGAWGEDQRRVILAKSTQERTIRASRVHAPGNPAWDALATQDHSSTRREDARRAIAARLSIPRDRPWLVLTAQETSAPQYPPIKHAVLATPDAVLIVKAHPREDASVYEPRSFAEESRIRVVAGASPALHDLLLAADATITFHSTTNLESLLVGTPVITVALGELRKIDRLVFLERFGLPLASDERELERVVAQAAGDPGGFRASLREPMARALAGLLANAGGASPKCADMIAPWSAGLVAPVTPA